jgi:hypothetical protein
MYVAKICRNNLIVEATLIDKRWSEEMLSNQIFSIKKRNFLLKSSAKRWINKQTVLNLIDIGKMEIQNG